MDLKQSMNHLKYDARMMDINFKNSNLSKEEWQKHLSQLPDLKDQCRPMELEDGDRDSFAERNS